MPVVHVVAPAAAAKSIEELDDADIAVLYDTPVRAALDALQRGRAAGETRFVFVIPAMYATGAAGFAATSAAAEAVRVLALGAARQWSDEGVTVNCLAAAPGDDITPVVDFLASDAGAGVSGQTIRVGGLPAGL